MPIWGSVTMKLCMVTFAYSFLRLNKMLVAWKRVGASLAMNYKHQKSSMTSTRTIHSLHSKDMAHLKQLQHSSELLNQIDAVIFDCDGVIWKGDTMIPYADIMLKYLRSLGKKIFFFTNSSMKSRKGYLAKFHRLGLEVHEDEIYASSFAASLHLQQHPLPPSHPKVYVIGMEGLEEELALAGIPYVGATAHANKQVELGPGKKVDIDPSIGAVIVGMDLHINYYKIQYAQLCLNGNPQCQFIATNLDRLKHLTDAQEWASNAAIVGAIRGCTGRKPILVGKPAGLMIDYLMGKYQLQRHRVCMVGDRLDTDVLFGRDHGLRTVLTLSGVTTKEVLHDSNNTIHPQYIINSVADFLPK